MKSRLADEREKLETAEVEKDSSRNQGIQRKGEQAIEASGQLPGKETKKSKMSYQQRIKRSKEGIISEKKPEQTQPTNEAEQSKYERQLPKEANDFEKAAFVDGTVLDPTKVKRLGFIDDLMLGKELEGKMSITSIKSVDTDSKKRVIINEKKCIVIETPDRPTEDADIEEPEPEDPTLL